MKLIELHILQSFPVSCLNRDDVGSPKPAVFGVVNRARISSQALKRPIRLALQELSPALFAGERSKLIIVPLADRIEKKEVGREQALALARDVGTYLATLDDKAAAKGVEKVKTLMFLSPAELDSIAARLAEAAKAASIVAPEAAESASPKKKKTDGTLDVSKLVAKACADVGLKDAADIALFGRMVANDHSITVEGAAMFSHALSTHKADNDLDFYTAVDDRQKEDPTVSEEDRSGSGMMGTLEFASAVYYRYAALNLDQLFYQTDREGKPSANLDCLNGAEQLATRHKIVDAFIRATLMAVPGARKNSMNANTLPCYVVGIYKSTGQPVQLVNAFDPPVFVRGGLSATSSREMLLHRAQMNRIFCLVEDEAVATGFLQPKPDLEPDRTERKLEEDMIPRHLTLDEFCKRLTSHVL